jgi:PAS domain S-box-containing protein
MSNTPDGAANHLRVVPKTGQMSPLFDGFFRAFVEAVDVAVCATDASGRIVYFNEAAVDFWGIRPNLERDEFCGSWKLYRADGTPLPHNQCPMAVALREKRPIRNVEAIAERPDGTRIAFASYPTPIFDESGALIGAVNILVEISGSQQTEEKLQRLAAIVESSNDAIISKDLHGVITSWNPEAERLFGYTAAQIVGKPITVLIPADHENEEPGILQKIREGRRVEHYETIRRRRDGSLVEVSLTVSPIKDSAGRVIGASKIVRDITERRRSEARTELLLNEMKHRVRNTLATVQGLAHQSLRGSSAAELAAFSARLSALAAAHDALTKDWDRARLSEVLTRALTPFDPTLKRFIFDGIENISLSATNAQALTMALHELATNAVKYGALSNETGCVRLQAEMRDRKLYLCWTEIGGAPVTPPARQGFGSRLIKNAFNEGSAKLDFAPGGLVCTLEIPV